MHINDITQFINFDKMFNYICENIVWLEDHESESSVKNFYENNRLGLDIISSECHLLGNKIWFVFGEDFVDSNESDPNGSFVCVAIRYNISTQCFDYYEYENG